MILLLSRTDDVATDVLVLELDRLALPYVRVNTDTVPARCRLSWTLDDAAIVTPSGARVALSDITSVWCRKPFGDETAVRDDVYPEQFIERESLAALSGLIETAPVTSWMNRPSAIRRAEQKLLQLRLAAELGFRVPETLVSNDPADVRAFAHGRDTIAKTIRATRVRTSGGSRLLYASQLDPNAMPDDDEIAACVTIYQARVPKDHDLRVTIAGDAMFGTRIRPRSPYLDWRAFESEDTDYDACDVPPDFAARCIALMKRLNLRYGAFDFSVTAAGEASFLEVNPGGQWGWLERATGAPMTNAIARALAITDEPQ